MRVCDGLPVFEFAIFSCVFSMILFSYISCGFCRCFVKPQLARVGGCQLCDLGLFYSMLSLVDALGRASQRHIMHFRLSFIDVS